MDVDSVKCLKKIWHENSNFFEKFFGAGAWAVNRITEPQPTIFDVTATDYYKSVRQPHQTATDYDNRQLTANS